MAAETFGIPVVGIIGINGMKCRCCCICKREICIDATNPDWAYWDCAKTAPFFVSDTEILYSMPTAIATGVSCDGGNGSAGISTVEGTTGFAFRIYGSIDVSITCNSDGTATLVANIQTRCALAVDNYYETKYSTTSTIDLITDSCACSAFSASSLTMPGTILHGSPPLPFGSLSPVTLSLSSGPCGTGVAAPSLSAQTAATAATRSLPCVSLGERVEFRAGCSSGFMCQHACTSSRPDVVTHLGGVPLAVPGDDCQTCPGYFAK